MAKHTCRHEETQAPWEDLRGVRVPLEGHPTAVETSVRSRVRGQVLSMAAWAPPVSIPLGQGKRI